MKEVDTDGNMEIEFPEFLQLMARNMQDIDEEKLIQTGFNVFDADGDGQVSLEDLRSVMQSLGEQMTDDQLNDIINEIDTNGDKQMSFEEFQATIEDKQ